MSQDAGPSAGGKEVFQQKPNYSGLILVVGLISIIVSQFWFNPDLVSRLIDSIAGRGAPEYVKQLSVLPEGDGVLVYFVLADADGTMTRASGKVHVELTETRTEWTGSEYKEATILLWAGDFDVKANSFRTATAGLGLFEHTILACNLGRIRLSEFEKRPTEPMGTAKLVFTTENGRTLELSDSCMLPS